jgi:hypothetical protein
VRIRIRTAISPRRAPDEVTREKASIEEFTRLRNRPTRVATGMIRPVQAGAVLELRSESTSRNFIENRRLRRGDSAPLAAEVYTAGAGRIVLETVDDGSPQEFPGLESSHWTVERTVGRRAWPDAPGRPWL